MNNLYISMYHYTRDLRNSRYPEIKGLDVSLFRQQIEYLKNNFNIDLLIATLNDSVYI